MPGWEHEHVAEIEESWQLCLVAETQKSNIGITLGLPHQTLALDDPAALSAALDGCTTLSVRRRAVIQ